MRSIAWMAAVSSAALLAGCAGTPTVTGVCPDSYKEYTADEQRRAANEMRDLQKEGRAPTIRSWIVDYGRLRVDARILCGR